MKDEYVELGIGVVILAALAGGFFLIYSIVQNENAQTLAIEQQSNGGGGLGGVITGVLGIFGL